MVGAEFESQRSQVRRKSSDRHIRTVPYAQYCVLCTEYQVASTSSIARPYAVLPTDTDHKSRPASLIVHFARRGSILRYPIFRSEACMSSRQATLASLIAVCLCYAAAAGEPNDNQAEIRSAIEKSLPLLMTAATGHRENRTCFACHNQGPPIMAISAARERGFKIDEDEFARQKSFISDFLGKNRENYLQGKGTGGQADTAGYGLWTLSMAGWKPDEMTAAVSEYLLLRHKEFDHWKATSNRPPSEAGAFTTTYLALYGLTAYGTSEQQQRIAARTAQVRQWRESNSAKDNEDRVFRLWALDAAGASPEQVAAAAKELLARQRDDGGWAQLDTGEPATALESDAYATGTALVALQDTAQLTVSDPAYQRGIAYLLKTQHDDGSWHVKSRSKPFQAYFESGFPHEKDQFISCAASAWATWALVLTLDKNHGHGQ